jgi:hypothetical protein
MMTTNAPTYCIRVSQAPSRYVSASLTIDFFRPMGSEKKNAAKDPTRHPTSYKPVISPCVRA